MRIMLKRMSILSLAVLGAATAGQAADLVVGSYAQPAVRVHRERPLVVRTTYVRHEPLDCQLLKISDPHGAYLVRKCFRPLF